MPSVGGGGGEREKIDSTSPAASRSAGRSARPYGSRDSPPLARARRIFAFNGARVSQKRRRVGISKGVCALRHRLTPLTLCCCVAMNTPQNFDVADRRVALPSTAASATPPPVYYAPQIPHLVTAATTCVHAFRTSNETAFFYESSPPPPPGRDRWRGSLRSGQSREECCGNSIYRSPRDLLVE